MRLELPEGYGPSHAGGPAVLWWAGFVWNLPNTLLGLALGVACLEAPRPSHGAINIRACRGPVRWVCDWLEISAFTVGDCVLYRAAPCDRIRVHELRHIAQYRVLGPLFLPAYFVLLALCGYCDHPLERDACRWEERWAADGGRAA